MATYLVFLRAVNVGGRKVPMAELRTLLAEHDFDDIETYIQTGNVRVGAADRSAAKVAARFERVLKARYGFAVAALVRTPPQLRALVDQAPASPLGPEARHYLTFLRDEPSPAAVEELRAWDLEGERADIVGRDVHLWFTKPSHEAKLSNTRIEKITGMDGTNRNWTVVSALAEKWS